LKTRPYSAVATTYVGIPTSPGRMVSLLGLVAMRPGGLQTRPYVDLGLSPVTIPGLLDSK